MFRVVKSRQSYKNGYLPYHCSFYYLYSAHSQVCVRCKDAQKQAFQKCRITTLVQFSGLVTSDRQLCHFTTKRHEERLKPVSSFSHSSRLICFDGGHIACSFEFYFLSMFNTWWIHQTKSQLSDLLVFLCERENKKLLFTPGKPFFSVSRIGIIRLS